ncbi:MAG: TolC family protein [Candidatus Cloacimonetes bacterium]|nr:TolC family protein [Candidatus Cloacimonadota bacterium]MDD4154978.1 TolC family protein [Candidatus Cloacimonadota bacterium]
MNKIWICIILIFTIVNVYSLTLDEAIEIGFENSPIIKSASQNLEQTKWDYYQSTFELFPTANLNASYTKYDPSIGINTENNKSYGIQASQTLFAGGKIWLNKKTKQNLYKASKENFSLKKIELLSEIENKFFNALEKKQYVLIAENEYNNAVTNEQIAQIRYNNGSLTEAELFRMKAQTVNKKVNNIQAKTNLLTAVIDLKNTLGIKDDVIPEDINEDVFEENMFNVYEWDMEQINKFVEDISQLSLSENTSLKVYQLNIKNVKNQLTMATGNFLPTVNLSYSKSYAKTNLEDDYSDSSTLMLNASIPILPFGNNLSSYLKNKANLRKNEFDYTTTENTISLNARSTALAWVSAIQTAKSAELSLEYAKKSWQQMNQRYKNGIISSSEMLDADIMLSNANVQYVTSRYNILRNKANLKKLLDIESDEEFIKLVIN